MTYNCFDPSTGKIDNFPVQSSIKLRICYRLTLECGEPYEINLEAFSRSVYRWEVKNR